MPELVRRPLSWFKVNPQARTQFDERELRLLGESLAVKQLQPVLAKPDGTLIAGERRLRAAALVGLKDLLAVVAEEALTDAQVRIFQLTENIHRASLTGFEKWHACEELLRLNPDWRAKDLAEHLKIVESTLTKYLSPSRCVPAVQQALEAGRIGITDCYAMSLLPPEDQTALLALKLAGASRDRVVQEGRKKRTGGSPVVKVSRIKCPLPSGATVQVSGEGISLDDAIEAAQEWIKAAKKAAEQGLDARTFQAVMRDLYFPREANTQAARSSRRLRRL